jgi:flagellar assembly protein FliH
MGLLRANQVPTAAVAFSMTDVEEAAKRVLLKAKLQAENLIAAAMEEAELLKEQAKQEGTREGFDHGHAEGIKHGQEAGRQQAFDQHAAELTSLAQTLTTAAAEFDAARRAVEADALPEIVALAVGVARRVTKRQGLIDPGVLEANLADAMNLAVGASDLRVAVLPAQRAFLESVLPRLKVQWPDLKHVELVDDPTLSPGGCRVFTRHGSIDAELDAQLDRVISELLPNGGAEPAKSAALNDDER